MRLSILSLCFALIASFTVYASDTRSNIMISDAWIREPAAGKNITAAYVTLKNISKDADTLTAVSLSLSPRVELHDMVIENGVMKMREAKGGIAIPAGAEITLKPGGQHIMLMDMTASPKAGEKITLKLTFAKAGVFEHVFEVKPAGAPASSTHSH